MICLLLLCGRAQAGPAIEIMVENAAAPWSAADGSGYANELVRAAYRAVNTAVTLKVVPYARCKAYVMQAQIAGCMSMSDSPELHGLVHFADAPLFSAHPVFFYDSRRSMPAAAMSELRPGIRIGIVLGYEYPASVGQLKERGVVLDAAASEELNLKKLAAGRLDLALVMLDYHKTAELLQSKAKVSHLAAAFDMEAQGSYLGFSTTHADGERARALFNQGYALIQANGIKKRIDDRWKMVLPAKQ